MARLLSWPVDLRVIRVERLKGPRSINSGITESLAGGEQTYSSPFGSISLQITFQPMQDRLARQHRGWISALHGGANATRFNYVDADRMEPVEAGIVGEYEPQRWSNGQPWSNGQWWKPSYPVVPVVSGAARGGTIVSLDNVFWGHALGMGDLVGFFPFHFGMYEITEVFEQGRYRIWPPLRKTISVDEFCTLSPTLALRLVGMDGATVYREQPAAQGLTATFIEAFDYDVREYFAD
ncbi:hypothetical protein ACHMW4_03910 [Mesorhizobium sp. UC22_110]|uniref:hypothetical protein n=1 Tax=unclassified Mesorhizobium TaxID=325217 RepID=UPI00366C7953